MNNNNNNNEDLKTIVLLENMVSETVRAGRSGLNNYNMITQFINYQNGNFNSCCKNGKLSMQDINSINNDTRICGIANSLTDAVKKISKLNGLLTDKIYLMSYNNPGTYSFEENIAKIQGSLQGQINKMVIEHYKNMEQIDHPSKDKYLDQLEQFSKLVHSQFIPKLDEFVKGYEKNNIKIGKLNAYVKYQKGKVVNNYENIIKDYAEDVILDCMLFTEKKDSNMEILQSESTNEFHNLKYEIQYLKYKAKTIDSLNNLVSGKKEVDMVFCRGLGSKQKIVPNKITVKVNEDLLKNTKKDINNIQKEYKIELKSLKKQFKLENKLGKKQKYIS